MDRTIYVIAEHSGGKISPVTSEMLTAAMRIQEIQSLPVQVVILGEAVSGLAGEISARTGVNVTALEIPGLSTYNGEVWREALSAFFREQNAAFICAGHTSQGTDFAPGLAVRLKAANITGVQGIAEQEEGPCFTRPVYGGKRAAHVRPRTGTVILNVQPGVFRPFRPDSPAPGTVRICRTDSVPRNTRAMGTKPSGADAGALAGAEVVVSAGNGVGEQENIDLIYQMAALFPRSAVGGSRIVCDRGWLAYGQQVGVTGTTVASRLYIACGISGAPQHLSGMSGSEFIVAINTDARAAIMNVADVCVPEDLTTFIPTFIEVCDKAKSEGKEEYHG